MVKFVYEEGKSSQTYVSVGYLAPRPSILATAVVLYYHTSCRRSYDRQIQAKLQNDDGTVGLLYSRFDLSHVPEAPLTGILTFRTFRAGDPISSAPRLSGDSLYSF